MNELLDGLLARDAIRPECASAAFVTALFARIAAKGRTYRPKRKRKPASTE